MAEPPNATQKVAGILFVAADKVLLCRRADSGLWAFPAGGIGGDEAVLDAAKRECVEELGQWPEGQNLWSVRQIVDGIDLTTICRRVPEPFIPVLNDENTEHGWFHPDALPSDIVVSDIPVIQRLSMDEFGVAKCIASGQFTSPQLFCNVYMFAVRVTGSGVAFRSGEDEWSYRDPKIFLTDEFQERCNGLPVLIQHTDAPRLTPEEFKQRIIGTLFCPHIRGDEVWAIARIWDADSAVEMATNQWSTSPGVLYKPSESMRVPLDGDKILLIEGKPFLFDHLAVVEQGVWDKGKAPSGVDATLTGTNMAEEQEDRRDRRDEAPADCGDASSRTDADAGGRSLDDLYAKVEKLIGLVQGSAAAAAPVADTLDENIPGEPLPIADRRDEASRVEKPDFKPDLSRAKLDADVAAREAESRGMERAEIERLERERKDSEERHKAAMDEMKAHMDAQIAAMKASMPRDVSDEDMNELSECESRADSVAVMFGKNAPRPMRNESPMGYRRRVAKGYQKHSKAFASTNLDILDPATFSHVEGEIYKAAKDAARTSADVPADKVIPFQTKDPITGRLRTQWRGNFRGGFSSFMESPNRATLRSQKG